MGSSLTEHFNRPHDRQTQREILVQVVSDMLINHLQHGFHLLDHVLGANAVVRLHTRLGPCAPPPRGRLRSSWGTEINLAAAEHLRELDLRRRQRKKSGNMPVLELDQQVDIAVRTRGPF